MKPHHLIAPALAFAGSGYWLYNQNDVIRELTEKTRIIRERVVVMEKATSEATVLLHSSKDQKGNDEFTLPDGSLDWKMIAAMMAESRGNNGMPTNIKAMLKLQQKMMELSEDEIVDGLAKISALDLEPGAVDMIKQGLLSQLSEKNPLAALQALGDPVADQSNSLFWTQTQIVSKVAKEDPAAAIAWMDRQIAEGKLQSTSLNQHQDPRLRLEGTLINELIASDFESAKSRLEDFTDDEKVHLLSSNHHNLKGEKGRNLIKLTRESLPPEKASETISSAFGSQYYDSLSGISEAVKDVPLTESEKTNAIERLVGNYSRNNDSDDKYEEIYEWSKVETPGKEVAIISNALNNSNNSWENPQASFEKALSVSESLGDAKILTSFVSKFSSNGNEGTVKMQIDKFKDPAVAEKYRALVEALPKDTPDSE